MRIGGVLFSIALCTSGCGPTEASDLARRPAPSTSTPSVQTTTTAGMTSSTSSTSSTDEFLDEALPWLPELVAAPAQCLLDVANPQYPVFHGCTDWHSAVHAAWSLHVVTRLTGDPQTLDIANSVLTQPELDQTLVDLQTGQLWFEVPYGFSWFLALSRERNLAGYTDLDPLADVVAADLQDHVLSLGPSEIADAMVNDDYDNVSWAVLNLWQWGVHSGDTALADWAEDFARAELLPRAAMCPIDDDRPPGDDFFPPCLHLAMVLLTALPPADTAAYVAGLPADYPIVPLVDFPLVHMAGLNFSRSWGLHSLWLATGEADYRLASQDHIRTHYGFEPYWAENEPLYAHWVPQFGVYGISLWFDSPQ